MLLGMAELISIVHLPQTISLHKPVCCLCMPWMRISTCASLPEACALVQKVQCCHTCGKTASNLLLCTKCKHVYYCNRDCQVCRHFARSLTSKCAVCSLYKAHGGQGYEMQGMLRIAAEHFDTLSASVVPNDSAAV